MKTSKFSLAMFMLAPWHQWGSLVAAKKQESFTVMTRNLYLGADLEPAFQALTTPGADLIGTAAAAVEQGIGSMFDARMKAIAAEIAESGAVLVGMQEVSTWSFNGIVVADFLESIKKFLSEDHGLEYEEVSPATTVFQTVVTGPGGVVVDFRYGDAILAKSSSPSELQVQYPQGNEYAANIALPAPLESYSFHRGWLAVDAKIPSCKKSFRFVTTHLESFDVFGPIRSAQATELATDPNSPLLTTDGPIVLVGDFNSVPDIPDATEILLNSGLADAWAATGDGGEGLTFGHDANLADSSHPFTRRIDYVTTKGDLVVLETKLSDPLIADSGRPLWPSDHAGVISTIACDSDDDQGDDEDNGDSDDESEDEGNGDD